ncbi:MAG: hypothetical protein HC799_01600 [Limnothrix sp. RL_2_0]|nr:hypothetical protein [Limnothrix sp. RL_2_0]
MDITTQLHLHPLMAWYGITRPVKGVDEKKLLVEVPAGVRDQTKLRLIGAGRTRGNEQGDLYVEIKIVKPKFFFLQKCFVAMGSVALGSTMILQLSNSALWDVWLILGCLLVILGILMLCGMIQEELSGKRAMGVGAFVCLSMFPALLINGFTFDINFTWTAAFGCATIGGIIGGLSLQHRPRPEIPTLMAGIIAANILLTIIYYYTKDRAKVWSYEIAVLVFLGVFLGLGLNWLLKKIS